MTRRGLAVVVGLVVVSSLLTGTASAAAPPKLKWGACPASSQVPPQVGCATLQVPLDYARPHGRQITLTISGVGGLSSKHFLLVNPGGPGAPGIGTEQLVSSQLPEKVTEQYAVFSFDPRGVGASTPVDCGDVTKVIKHPGLPYRPANVLQELSRITEAKKVAAKCAAKAMDLLPYITTENVARDMDRIRLALGKDKIDYLGYSYGTKLGATYATMFPSHVGRLVLDSVVDPTVTTYQTAYEQNVALQKRAGKLFAWTAARDSTYHLGKTAPAVQATWRKVSAQLAKKPAGGRAGAAELNDMLASSMYLEDSWSTLMDAVAQYRAGDPAGILSAADQIAEGNPDVGQLAFNCMDEGWPRSWTTWHRDTVASDRTAPDFAWLNTWYGAPCAFWPVAPVHSVKIGSVRTPPALLLQSREDSATPLVGAQQMRKVLKGSRLLTRSGGDHATYLIEPNSCIDPKVANYLLTGQLPSDANCS